MLSQDIIDITAPSLELLAEIHAQSPMADTHRLAEFVAAVVAGEHEPFGCHPVAVEAGVAAGFLNGVAAMANLVLEDLLKDRDDLEASAPLRRP